MSGIWVVSLGPLPYWEHETEHERVRREHEEQHRVPEVDRAFVLNVRRQDFLAEVYAAIRFVEFVVPEEATWMCRTVKLLDGNVLVRLMDTTGDGIAISRPESTTGIFMEAVELYLRSAKTELMKSAERASDTTRHALVDVLSEWGFDPHDTNTLVKIADGHSRVLRFECSGKKPKVTILELHREGG
jgi:hypothetical protein